MSKRTKFLGIIFGLLVITEMAAFAAVKVYPVPWAPESGKDRYGDLAAGITFDGITGQGEILIYTINGEQARRIPFSGPAGGKVQWNGRNDDGAYVASGVYLWVVKSGDSTVTGKLIVIR